MSESGSTPTKPVPAPRRGRKPKEPRASNKLKNFKAQFGIEIWFKIGAEGSFGVAARGKGCFLCSTNRIWEKPYLSDVCSRVLQVPCNGRPSLLSRLAKKGGSVGNTRLSLPHAKMLLVPLNCFLCRVDFALEENVLTEQIWVLAAY